uniref:Dirigent protein n=1 Tax=Ananas comosus var. bracteatus TaxID=296719 RepID=A0A6V7P134_ANACO|nr:unnamed protein product [Ananas comosus var. bracteatus]
MASLSSFICHHHHLLLFLFAAVVAAAVFTTKAVTADDNMTHLHFYMHDILGGSNPTAIEIVKAPSRCLPSPASTLEASLLMSVNFVLAADGPYNGSVVSVQGRDPIAAPVRELSVVGGTGQFRMARGYVLWKTYDGNATTTRAVNDTNGDNAITCGASIFEIDVNVTTK